MPSSIIRRTAAVAALTIGSMTFLAGPAGAQECYPPTPDCTTTTSSTTPTAGPSISLSFTTVVRGQTIAATVRGFRAGTSGIITIASVEQQIGSFTMPADGGATTTSITIPATITLGAHTVFARGTLATGVAGSASQGVTVVASSTTSTTGSNLARTGFAALTVGLIGTGLVLGGLALKRSGGKRKARSAS
jgi:hypothetical protein